MSNNESSPVVKDIFRVYAVYDHPPDYPDHYVVRRWDLVQGEFVPSERLLIQAKDLTIIHHTLEVQMRLTLVFPMLFDDSTIIETYI